MLTILLLGLFIALSAPFLQRIAGSNAGYIISLFPAAMFLFFCSLLPEITTGHAVQYHYEWVPQLGISLSFYIDGLSLLFALLISLFGVLIVLYASSYLKHSIQLGRFYMYLILFMISMIGVVTAGNLISLFVFWELTSLSSYLLISYDHEQYKSRASALQAMLVTVLGGLVMLAGFIVLGIAAGSFELQEILQQHDLVVNHGAYTAMVLLILIGAFTKSAQFPFHFWLPNAMAAPTPVSAYLHSATMVKAGVFLVARLSPALGATDLWQYLLVFTGAVTMLIGALQAFRYTDLKKILAYTTISALGTLFLMLGAGTAYAAQAAIVFLLAHALYKGTLFMMAGNLDHQAGSRDINDLSGLRKSMPVTASAAILACLSMSGVIPFLGFIGKELLYEAALDETVFNIALAVIVVASNALITAIAILIGYRIFFGAHRSPAPVVKEAYTGMLIGPALLSFAGLLFGILPQLLTQPLLNISVIQILPDVSAVKLSLWHGFNLVLLLSVLTLALGWLIYRFRRPIRTGINHLFVIDKAGPAVVYEKLLQWTLDASYRITRFLQNGYLRYYIATVMWFFVGLLMYVIISRNLQPVFLPKIESLMDFRFYEEIICLFLVLGVIQIFLTNSRLTALASMGVVGYSLALIFIMFSAPDTAITQFLIETLTVVLFVLVLHKLPLFEETSERLRRYGYLFLSMLFGGIMTYILLVVRSYPLDDSLKNYFAANSVPLGHGRNIVNVILVDFRALDTLGEVVVLAMAAIGIFALLKLKIDKEKIT